MLNRAEHVATPRWRKSVAALTLLTTIPGTNVEPKQHHDVAAPTIVAPPIPENTCRHPLSNNSADVLASERKCQEEGEVVVVDFTNKPNEVKLATSTAQAILEYQTDHFVTPSFSVILASREARRKLKASVKKDGGCVKGSVSLLADKTMQLQKYDFVVGISPYPPCESKAGIATFRGRHSDVFASKKIFDIRETAITTAHELGHNYGDHHAGRVLKKDPAYPRSFQSVTLSPAGAKLSLKEYLKPDTIKYEEYGDSLNFMGQYPHPLRYEYQARPNQVQLDALRSYAGVPQLKKILAIEGPLTITPHDAQNGTYALWQLDNPITLTAKRDITVQDKKGKWRETIETSPSFNALALVPRMNVNKLMSFQIYLTDQNGRTVSIAEAYRDMEN